MAPHDVHLLGRHVELVPLQPDHAPELAALLAAGDDTWAWMTSPEPRDVDSMRPWIAARIAGRDRGGALAFAQRHPQTGRLMGSTSLFDIDATEESGEIGYTWLAAPYRRTGANTEAKLMLLRHGFDTLRLQRVQLVTDSRNVRSQRAIERIGATREGVLRSFRRSRDGNLRDSVFYSVVAREWPAVRERLEKLSGR